MISIGTSGYNYPEWRGSFYPSDLPASRMLSYYAERLSTVEINYSFYRLPNEKVLEGWAQSTPESFSFTLKAPRRITHDARLRDCEELTQTFGTGAQILGSKLAVLLFQMPASFRKDLGALDTFLRWVPRGMRLALEFRHDSWHSEDVFERLKAANAALCIADSEKMTTPTVVTADYGYFRLRDEGYQEADISRWADVILEHASDWKDVFVYFKHEEEGKGLEFARALTESLESRAGA